MALNAKSARLRAAIESSISGDATTLPPELVERQKAWLNRLPPTSPLRNKTNAARLLRHIKLRLDDAKQRRDAFYERWSFIDRELAGYIKLSDADRERYEKRLRGEGVAMSDIKLLSVAAKLEESVSYFVGVYMPNGKMFWPSGSAATLVKAKALAKKLNADGDKTRLMEAIKMGLHHTQRYGLGCWLIEWIQRSSPNIAVDATGQVKLDAADWSGNRVRALSPYNCLFDSSVAPVDCAVDGEYFAYAEKISNFNLIREAEQGRVLNLAEALQSGTGEFCWYRPPPVVMTAFPDSGGGSGTNWDSYLGGAGYAMGINTHEITNCWIWLRPSFFGIDSSSEAKCYCVSILNGRTIIGLEEIPAPHGQLPIAVAEPSRDVLEGQERTPAEMLAPLANVQSSMINIYIRSMRKKLYGLTLFNPHMVDLLKTKSEDSESSQVPIKTGWQTRSIQEGVMKLNDAPQTENMIQEVAQINQLMEEILPTQLAQNLANLDRANNSQVSNLVNTTNRRQHTTALLMQTQAIQPIRVQLLMNLAYHGGQIPYTDEKGQQSTMDSRNVYEIGYESFVADGLKSMDRVGLVTTYNMLFGLLVQVKDVNRRVNLLGIINYIGGLLGDETDLTQFDMVNPVDQLPAELQDILFQMLESGQLQGLLQQQLMQQQEMQKLQQQQAQAQAENAALQQIRGGAQ